MHTLPRGPRFPGQRHGGAARPETRGVAWCPNDVDVVARRKRASNSDALEIIEQKWHYPGVKWSLLAIKKIVFLNRQSALPGLAILALAVVLAARRAALARCAAILWLVLSLPAHAAALQITDDRGVTVTLSAPPQRIVSLLPSLTETVCELGQCGQLVGLDRYSNWPASVRALPRVGGGLDPNIEAVVALKPDLVLLATSTRAAARLQALGLNVVALEPRSHADARRAMIRVARLLGLPDGQGEQTWQRIDAALSAAARSLPTAARGARVYFEVSSGPYAAGESSFIGETLKRIGVRNIVPAALGAFPKLNPEFVVRADPDVILIGDEDFSSLSGRPGWADLRAVREQRVCVFPPEQADVLVRAGPRMAEAARLMVACLAARAPASVTNRATDGDTVSTGSRKGRAP